MLYGLCTSPDNAGLAARSGYDFYETPVGALLKPLEPEAAFQAVLATSRAAGLPCLTCNCLLPGDLKVVGPAVDGARVRSYMETVCRRAEQAGVKRLVFGSGGARKVPDGFPRERAWAQLAEFLRLAGGLAARHGLEIVIEPLTREVCNILTTIGEAHRLAREVDLPTVRLLADNYHWSRDGDSVADLEAAGPWLRHVHVNTTRGLAPGDEEFDFSRFFGALRRGGYNLALSIERQAGEAGPAEVWFPRARQELEKAFLASADPR